MTVYTVIDSANLCGLCDGLLNIASRLRLCRLRLSPLRMVWWVVLVRCLFLYRAMLGSVSRLRQGLDDCGVMVTLMRCLLLPQCRARMLMEMPEAGG